MKLTNLITTLLFSLFYLHCGKSQYQNISSFQNFENSKQASFEYNIPNTSLRLKINITIQLIDQSLPELTTTTTTTTRDPWVPYRIPTSTDEGTKPRSERRIQYTVLDAIDAFKRDLVEKEKRIGGILESPGVFHRHFNLVYDNCEIRIKCSYYSNYSKRTLNIYCFELHENNNRGGEREALQERVSYNINPTIIHVDRYHQTLHMKVQ